MDCKIIFAQLFSCLPFPARPKEKALTQPLPPPPPPSHSPPPPQIFFQICSLPQFVKLVKKKFTSCPSPAPGQKRNFFFSFFFFRFGFFVRKKNYLCRFGNFIKKSLTLPPKASPTPTYPACHSVPPPPHSIDNAFDYMGLCFVVKQKNYFSEYLLVLPRSYFHNRIPR